MHRLDLLLSLLSIRLDYHPESQSHRDVKTMTKNQKVFDSKVLQSYADIRIM